MMLVNRGRSARRSRRFTPSQVGPERGAGLEARSLTAPFFWQDLAQPLPRASAGGDSSSMAAPETYDGTHSASAAPTMYHTPFGGAIGQSGLVTNVATDVTNPGGPNPNGSPAVSVSVLHQHGQSVDGAPYGYHSGNFLDTSASGRRDYLMAYDVGSGPATLVETFHSVVTFGAGGVMTTLQGSFGTTTFGLTFQGPTIGVSGPFFASPGAFPGTTYTSSSSWSPDGRTQTFDLTVTTPLSSLPPIIDPVTNQAGGIPYRIGYGSTFSTSITGAGAAGQQQIFDYEFTATLS
jgi:hypothetical protein